jgi:hypothetical protein
MRIYYIGSVEGHEYLDLQVGDEVNPRTFFLLFKINKTNRADQGNMSNEGSMISEIPKTGRRAARSISRPLGWGGRTQFDL